MPNIEVHGYRPYQNDDLRVIFGRIQNCLRGAPYLDDVVVTVVDDAVLNMKGEHEPFLRVLWTPETSKEDLEDLERRLCTLDPPKDLEFIPLAKFKSAKDIKIEREATLQTLRNLRPAGGTDKDFADNPNYKYGRDAEGYGKHESMK